MKRKARKGEAKGVHGKPAPGSRGKGASLAEGGSVPAPLKRGESFLFRRCGGASLVWISGFAGLLVFLSFLPALGNEFVNWDDKDVLLNNSAFRGLGLEQLRWMFSTFHSGHYHPLTWMSFGLDYLLWGMNPRGYHLTNIILHAGNTVLFFWLILALLRRSETFAPLRGTAGFCLCGLAGALFFGLHPLRVESVAWATERRDVLSSLFYLLTLLCYLKGCESANSSGRKWRWGALIFFTFSLLSKAWGITLPVVLLILDLYPLRRITLDRKSLLKSKKILLEKIPFFLLAFSFALLAFLAQKKYAMQMVADHGIFDRLVQAAYGLCLYPLKTILPIRLSPLYLLHQTFEPTGLKYVLSGLFVLALTIALFRQRSRRPWALTAWACYGVIVSPVLGIAQSGEQIAADRYTYLSCLPFAVLLAAGLLRLQVSEKEGKVASGIGRSALLLTALGLLSLDLLTFRQTSVWHDSHTLWNHAIKLDPTNYVALNNRGNIFFEEGDAESALADLSAAIERNPAYAKAYYNRGNVRKKRGDMKGAIEDMNAAIRHRPAYFQAYNNRGILRQRLGDPAGAMADFTKAVQLNPLYPLAYKNRGALYEGKGMSARAMADFNEALRLNPNYAEAYFERGKMRLRQNDAKGAEDDFNEALRLRPDFVDAYTYRAGLRGNKGDLSGALEDYERAIRLNPGEGIAYLNRGVILQKKGRIKEAFKDYNRAIQLSPDDPLPYFHRGTLQREEENLEAAIADYTHALRLDSNYFEAYLARGGLLGNRGDFKGVMADFTKALEIAPPDWPGREKLNDLILKARKLLEGGVNGK